MKDVNFDHEGSRSESGTIRTVRCPSCGGESLYAPSNPARPFCSARCKNMDFGAWASESFRMSAPLTPDDLTDVASTLQSSTDSNRWLT